MTNKIQFYLLVYASSLVYCSYFCCVWLSQFVNVSTLIAFSPINGYFWFLCYFIGYNSVMKMYWTFVTYWKVSFMSFVKFTVLTLLIALFHWFCLSATIQHILSPIFCIVILLTLLNYLYNKTVNSRTITFNWSNFFTLTYICRHLVMLVTSVSLSLILLHYTQNTTIIVKWLSVFEYGFRIECFANSILFSLLILVGLHLMLSAVYTLLQALHFKYYYYAIVLLLLFVFFNATFIYSFWMAHLELVSFLLIFQVISLLYWHYRDRA